MPQNSYSSEEFDRLKADAIRRARQMHQRRGNINSPIIEKPQTEENLPREDKASAPFPINNIYNILKLFNLNNDQAILLGLILLISQNKENIPLIIALLYIAM